MNGKIENSPSAVLFDLDGTLVDSLPLIKKTYRTVFKDMGIPWGDDDVMKWVGKTLRTIAVNFAGIDLAEEFTNRYQSSYFTEHDKYIRLFPGTERMLEWLKTRNIKTGVVTSKGREGTMKALKHTAIEDYMDIVIAAEDLEKHKPLPDPILKAMEFIKVEASKSYYVGDSIFDIEAGNASGVKSFGVSWGICEAEELWRYDPVDIFNSWEDMLKYL
ncbi:MAG: HAD hydrolase-like protein [Peptococcaceae bacterium]|nr:HAD hydrolase-like protein [Peptococcaceae bacterium]